MSQLATMSKWNWYQGFYGCWWCTPPQTWQEPDCIWIPAGVRLEP